MKKYLFQILMGFLLCGYSLLSWADNPFSVATPAKVQNMVKNSSQTLVYTLSSPALANVHCSFTPNSPYLTYSFNNSGCTASGGVGVNSGLAVSINLTLNVSNEASGTVTGVLKFQQTNGMQYSKSYNVSISVPTTRNRTVTFKNYCPFTVNIGIASSAVPAKNNGVFHACTKNSDCSAYTYSLCVDGFCGGGACEQDSDCQNTQAGTCAVPTNAPSGTSATCTYCGADSDCIEGASCAANHLCFWNLPLPTGNNYTLAEPSGGVIASNTITLTDYSNQNGFALLWGGGFAGRTGCGAPPFTGGNSCVTAGCNINGPGDGNGGCNLGEGFLGPVSQIEATFVSRTPDTYDVTMINGENIPIKMYPTVGSAASPQTYNNPYICGYPGNPLSTVTGAGTLGGCSWEFSPKDGDNHTVLAYNWVDDATATNCDISTPCTSGYICGLTSDAVGTSGAGSSQTTCGNRLGYWNQNQICTANPTYNQAGIVNCTLGNIKGTGNSMLNLLQCTGSAAVSCFNINSKSNTCCGCTNWQTQGVSVPTNPSIVTQCQFANPYWAGSSTVTGYVLPNLVWLKKGCPSAYVYPYDDKTSTFTCPSNNGQSAVNYSVDFCPPVPA